MADGKVTRRDFVRGGAVATVGVALGLSPTYTVHAGNPEKDDTGKILNYNSDMEYRRLGKTNLMISAVCLGGHWKRIDVVLPKIRKGEGWMAASVDSPEFDKNRADVMSRCIERGINYVDACTGAEVVAYAKALKGRRDKMYFGFSAEGMRGFGDERQRAQSEGKTMPAGWITRRLKEDLDRGLKNIGLEYVDLWRITCLEQSGQHADDEIEEMVAALDWAKKTGRARFTGISSHDRPHIKKLIDELPDSSK